MERKIKVVEYFCGGKVQREKDDNKKDDEANDDNIYIGENYVAVIDGVSHKSSVTVNGKQIKIADIIVEAIQKADTTPYAKTLEFDEMVKWINLYIKTYLERNGLSSEVGKMEATAAIYSKQNNQIWLVGDCRAIYDGKIISNPLKVDELYINLRTAIIKALLSEKLCSIEDLLKKDIAKEIIQDPEFPSLLENVFFNKPKRMQELKSYWDEEIKKALLDCDIQVSKIPQEFYNPRNLQKIAKNNKSMGTYGYAVLDGKYTELSNCVVESLPDSAKKIILSTDGFPIDALKNGIGSALKARNEGGKKDRLSINGNKATHSSKIYSENYFPPSYATDDASAVEFIIEKQIEPRKSPNTQDGLSRE